jgi:hypothetical protein
MTATQARLLKPSLDAGAATQREDLASAHVDLTGYRCVGLAYVPRGVVIYGRTDKLFVTSMVHPVLAMLTSGPVDQVRGEPTS